MSETGFSRMRRHGVNLDGTLWTPQAVAGSDHALLLFGRQDLDPLEASTWAEFWRESAPSTGCER